MKAFADGNDVVVAESWDDFVKFTKYTWGDGYYKTYKEIPITTKYKICDKELTVEEIAINEFRYNGMPVMVLSEYD